VRCLCEIWELSELKTNLLPKVLKYSETTFVLSLDVWLGPPVKDIIKRGNRFGILTVLLEMPFESSVF
jgi:hypothetical protein